MDDPLQQAGELHHHQHPGEEQEHLDQRPGPGVDHQLVRPVLAHRTPGRGGPVQWLCLHSGQRSLLPVRTELQVTFNNNIVFGFCREKKTFIGNLKPEKDPTDVVVTPQVLRPLYQRVGGRGPQQAERLLPGGRERPGGSPGGQPGGSGQERSGGG